MSIPWQSLMWLPGTLLGVAIGVVGSFIGVMASLAMTWHGFVAAADDLYKPDRDPREVAKVDADWKDASRNREVPVRIYAPKAATDGTPEKLPLIVFSHGLGGSRNSDVIRARRSPVAMSWYCHTPDPDGIGTFRGIVLVRPPPWL